MRHVFHSALSRTNDKVVGEGMSSALAYTHDEGKGMKVGAMEAGAD
jgi:hypothetical protein